MTVQNTTVKDIYVGNGATTKFPITFQMTDHPEYIKVYITGDDSVAKKTENFTVDLEAKTVTYPAAGDPLPDGHKITIYRELPLYQLMNLVNQGPFFAENIELSFDDLTFICQQLNEKLNRTLSAGIDVSNFNNTFPVKAGMGFRINDAGDGLVLTEDPAKVLPLAKDVLEQTKQVKESAVNETTNIKNTAIEELTAIKDAAVNETTEIKDEAVAAKNTAVEAATTAAGDAAQKTVENITAEIDSKVAAAEDSEKAAAQAALSAATSMTAAQASKEAASKSANSASSSAVTATEQANRAQDIADGLESLAGITGVATTEEAIAGEVDTKVMTPLKTKELMEFSLPSIGFRRMNTAYNVGDKVNCAFKFELFLECTQAGTTSEETLDTRNVTHGQVITDGTVKWTVRTHIKSVNGVVAGADGDVQIPTGEPVGFETICFSNNIPAGYLPYKGATYTRAAYADLWQWAQDTGRVKTETEWQALYESQNGNVPYYSDGDGSTTFRVPNIKGWTKADSTAGNYLEAGLPNITGYLSGTRTSHANDGSGSTGALYWQNPAHYGYGNNTVQFTMADGATLDASRSNSIYGNADTVQPESVTVIYIVKAYGVVNNVGSTAVQNVETELSSHIHVVEMYRNGTEWYRKWSDGWIEQGGIVPTTSTNFTVTFQVPFADTNYTLTTTGDYSWNQVDNAVQSYSTTQFSGLYQKQIIDFRWYACGMGAE